MATLEKRGDRFRVIFYLAGQRHSVSLKTDDSDDADALCTNIERRLRSLERGDSFLPEGADLETWLLSNGALQKPIQRTEGPRTLHDLFEAYFKSLPEGHNEKTTLGGMRIHQRHLERLLRKGRSLSRVTHEALQEYVNKRAKEAGLRGTVTPTTIKRAIVTLRTIWRWAKKAGHISAEFPGRDLHYPKGKEKPPFMTYAEIERATKGMKPEESAELWDALFLTVPEIDQLLAHVRKVALQPFIYPMIAFAAYTGARRSEILRTGITDVDFVGGIITIHERKRKHDQVTTRRVPIHPKLAKVLKAWLKEHPGGPQLFVQQAQVGRSRKRSQTTGWEPPAQRSKTTAGRMKTVQMREPQKVAPVTRDEAHDHLKRVLARSKWEVMRGYHTLRHSFISNAVAAGVDERMLDQWAGHTTEIRQRYIHLLPHKQKSAILSVFGK